MVGQETLERQRHWERVADHWTIPRDHFLIQQEDDITLAQIRHSLSPYTKKMRQSSGRVLDIGSGGLPTLYLPKDVLPRLVALDISRKALSVNLAAYKIVADIREGELPIQDGKISTASMFFVNRYVEDQDQLLEEVDRILEPGGRLVCMDYTTIGYMQECAQFNPYRLRSVLEELGWTQLQVAQVTSPSFKPRELAEDSYTIKGAILLLTGKKPQ